MSTKILLTTANQDFANEYPDLCWVADADELERGWRYYSAFKGNFYDFMYQKMLKVIEESKKGTVIYRIPEDPRGHEFEFVISGEKLTVMVTPNTATIVEVGEECTAEGWKNCVIINEWED